MLIVRQSFLLVYLLFLVACSSSPGPATRVFPLVAGVEPGSGIQRLDIDKHKSAPPSLGFEVDCRALPYAKGEERDFCYRMGSWAVVGHERGIIVACSCGEFGGFVLWYSKGGNLLQTLITGDVPQTLICDGDAFLCVTGLSHLVSSEGALHAFRLVGDRWQSVGSHTLAKEVDCVDIEPDGSIVLKLHWDAGTFRYRAGSLEPLPFSFPRNTTQQPAGAPSGAAG